MNKLFLFCTITCAALTVTGCSNSELSESEGNAPNAIGFEIYQGRMPVTRAETNVNSIQTKGFGVLASRTSADWSTTDAPNFLYDQRVTYSSSWTYDPIKYWPTNDDKISFWAYAPYGDSNISLSAKTKAGAPTATVTLPNGADLDFVADCAMNKTYQAPNGNVDFSLKHVMTRAAFKIEGRNLPTGTSLEITSITLSGTKLYSSATYTFPVEDGINGTWSSQQSGASITLTQDISEGTNSNYLYLIPVVSLENNDISVAVSYTVTLPGDAPVSKISTVYIPAGGLVMGKSYLYTFTYDIEEDSDSEFHPISFSASVTSWGADTAGDLVQ